MHLHLVLVQRCEGHFSLEDERTGSSDVVAREWVTAVSQIWNPLRDHYFNKDIFVQYVQFNV